MPKERNTLFFSVFSEGPIQPMEEHIAQVDVKKRPKNAKTTRFWAIWVICLPSGIERRLYFPRANLRRFARWPLKREAQARSGLVLPRLRVGLQSRLAAGSIYGRDEMGRKWDYRRKSGTKGSIYGTKATKTGTEWDEWHPYLLSFDSQPKERQPAFFAGFSLERLVPVGKR
jgi:hypothetical protein